METSKTARNIKPNSSGWKNIMDDHLKQGMYVTNKYWHLKDNKYNYTELEVLLI